MVLRPVLLRAVVGLVTALTALTVAIAPAEGVPGPGRDGSDHQVPPEYDAPLLVTIDELTPGEVPERGPVVVRGTVVNRDVEKWSGISLYPFVNAGADCTGCPAPITSRSGLAEATETDFESVVGNRITDASATVDELDPGEVAPYSIRVPRSLLPVSSPGVYWFGVHALGESESSPDDGLADGKARTFLPYVPRGKGGIRGRVDTAIVVPLRYRIRHLPNGRIARTQEWEDAFDVSGELGAPLEFGSGAVGQPVSWLVDPAVLDAARLLRRGNPPRNLGPVADEDGGNGGQTPTDDASAAPEEEDPAAVADGPVAAAAAEWLDAVELELRGNEVLALPYGDIDMSAAPERMPDLYPMARAREGDMLSSWGTPTSPVVSSPGGYLDPSAIPNITDDSTLLLTDRMFDGEAFPEGAPVVGAYAGHKIAVTSYGAATGGPGPEPQLGAIAFRQRVLAEAAVRLFQDGRRHPLVVVVPRAVDGADATAFWSGLDADWLNLTTVAGATDRATTPIDPDELSYPVDQESVELPFTVFSEGEDLLAAGTTLQNLITDAKSLENDVRDEVLTGTSYLFRTEPEQAGNRLARSRRWIEHRLQRVTVEGPPAVTLSSADGSFAVTVSNKLDRNVTVKIAAESVDDEVDVDVGEPVTIAAESRTTIVLDAHSRATGVHNVTLSVTDLEGTALGSSVEVPIRSGQVSEVIWVILGGGVGILFVAIALRILRRFRNRGTAPAGGTTEGAA